MRDHLLLFINGTRHEIRGPAAFQPLTTFLRDTLHLTGSKIVCSEGDCGSCTLLLGRPSLDRSAMRYTPVCGCIQYLAQLDASHIVTIEGLTYSANNTPLNPVQNAMVKCQGTQCGFCTPGFVVAMHDHLEATPNPSRQSLTRALTGNLCRCTGYDSILNAGLSVDRAAMKTVSTLYPDAKLLPELLAAQAEEVLLETSTQKLYKPTTVANASRFRANNPNCTIITGGTDIGVVANKRIRPLTAILSTAGLRELETLTVSPDALHVGARVPLSDLTAAAATALPEFARMMDLFGSPLIRNAGTLGGNIANGSPIGDTMPALFVLDAQLHLASAAASRTVNINAFYTGYRKTVMTPDELITAITIPLPAKNDIFKLYKMSRRKDLDISSFAAAILLTPNETTNAIAAIRIAYNGVGPVIQRLQKTEQSLLGKPLTRDSFEHAAAIAVTEVSPISDVRGEADYRRQLARNILLKFFNDTLAYRPAPHAPLPPPRPAEEAA